MSEQTEETVDGLPNYILYIVVFSRVLYSGLLSTGVLAVVAHFTDLPFIPLNAMEMGEILVLSIWTLSVALIIFSVTALGFKVWMYLSWRTAMLFSKDLREEIQEMDLEEETE